MKSKKNFIILTIIIPAYNSEKFIFKCLKSIPNEDNIETIIIDDFSNKNLKDQIINYELKNLKIFRNNVNLGPGISRNKGIKNAKGKFILFLDSDDYLNCKNIVELIKLIKNDEINDFYLCRYKKETFPKDNNFFLKKLPKNLNKEILIESIVDKNYPIDECWSILFKKKFLIKKKIFFPKNIRIGEDEIFLAKILINFNKASIFKKTIYYHQNIEGSLSSNLSNFNSHLDFINLFYLFCNLYLEKNYKKNETLILQRYINILYSRISLLLLLRNNYELKKILKFIVKNYNKNLIKISNLINLINFKYFIKSKQIKDLKYIVNNNIRKFLIDFKKPKNIFIYCKGLLAKSISIMCLKLNIKVLAIVDDSKVINQKMFGHKIIGSDKLYKIIKSNENLDFKIIIANNRKITFRKIKRSLIKNNVSSKKIMHFY